MRFDATVCRSLSPICCCAYSLLFIHLIMGGGWEKMLCCQWPNHRDSIITTINPSNTPVSPSSVLPPPHFPTPLSHTHTQRPDDKTQNAHFWVLTLKNNHISCQHPHLQSHGGASMAAIKKCEEMCSASVCWFYPHFQFHYRKLVFFPKG